MSAAITPAINDGVKRSGRLRDYLAIARFDHATKHVFILPGITLALLLRGIHETNVIGAIILGGISALCIASANYSINEFLDRDFDQHHPTKSARTAVNINLNPRLVAAEWLLFFVVGLTCALAASQIMFWIALAFAAQGVVYNVQPLRSKDRAYVDVITESINNPLRLMYGWAMIDPTSIPPASIILSFWLGGAFLMGAKRLSEYKEITASHGEDVLTRYRASFKGYTENSLLVSVFVYAILSSFFIAVFLVKYRVEYLFIFPFLTALFARYLSISLVADSTAQRPEKLFRERILMGIVGLVVIVFGVATSVDFPFMHQFTDERFILITRTR